MRRVRSQKVSFGSSLFTEINTLRLLNPQLGLSSTVPPGPSDCIKVTNFNGPNVLETAEVRITAAPFDLIDLPRPGRQVPVHFRRPH